MKKSICIILSLLMLLPVFTSCKDSTGNDSNEKGTSLQGNTEETTATEIKTLEPGKMRLITKETYIENNPDFTFPEYVSTFSYNENGRLLKKETTLNGEYHSTVTYTYDENGNLYSAEYVEPSSNKHFIETYMFDENNRLIKFTDGWYDDKDFLHTKNYDYEYDSQGRLIYSEGLSAYGPKPTTYKNATTFEYDENGNLLKADNGDTYTYLYDEKGRIKEIQEVYYGTTDIRGITTYEYDEKGNCTASIYYVNGEERIKTGYNHSDSGRLTYVYHSVAGSEAASYSWTFTYDEYGNASNIDKYYSYRGNTYPGTYEYTIMDIDTDFEEEIINEQNGIIGLEEIKTYTPSKG